MRDQACLVLGRMQHVLWTLHFVEKLMKLFLLLGTAIVGLCVVGSFFRYVGDAGNTSLVDAGTPLGATAVVTPRSAGYLLWECCILASL